MSDNSKIIKTDLMDFFKEELEKELEKQKLVVMENTIFYVMNVLYEFFKTEKLLNEKGLGISEKPLVFLMAEAMKAALTKRIEILKSIGDNTLYITGFFPESIDSSLNDKKYFIEMGEAAYGSLASIMDSYHNDSEMEKVFNELSSKFSKLVDVITGISDKTKLKNDKGIIEIYSKWLKTGNQRAKILLKKKGINLQEE
ncbi:MAG: hypothetical protein ABIA04_14280 [Pseudomonadota bacterium]